MSDAESTKEVTASSASAQCKSKPSTFASIITGGRSPKSDDETPSADDADDPPHPPEDYRPNAEPEVISTKVLKRKRRIEFNTLRAPAVSAVSSKMPNDSEPSSRVPDNSQTKFQCDNIDTCDASQPADEIQGPTECGEDETLNGDDAILKLDICNLKDLLESKVKFLCQDRPDVSPVQIIKIQLETLLTAYDAEALSADYILAWLNRVATDLKRLEEDAAPAGWKCVWDREVSRYRYENRTSGKVLWEYPVDNPSSLAGSPQDTIANDDAMDICTTPPPHEFPVEFQAPDPPAWVVTKSEATELVPSSTTAAGLVNTPIENINRELASFYSDLSSLEPITSTAVEPTVTPDDPPKNDDATDGANVDEKKKKKKKRTKKLEPWRSGNLETWINKWQAAQKELDG